MQKSMYDDLARLGTSFHSPLRSGEDPPADFFAFFLAGALTGSPLALSTTTLELDCD